MRHALLVALLAAGLTAGLAATASAKVARITVTDFTTTDGVLGGTGMLGGVQGTIISTTTNGDCTASCVGPWTMTVGDATFASGTFACTSGNCVYLGAVAVERPSNFAISTSGAMMSGAIVNHGALVSDVSIWANTHQAVLAGVNLTVDDFVGRVAGDNGAQ